MSACSESQLDPVRSNIEERRERDEPERGAVEETTNATPEHLPTPLRKRSSNSHHRCESSARLHVMHFPLCMIKFGAVQCISQLSEDDESHSEEATSRKGTKEGGKPRWRKIDGQEIKRRAGDHAGV